MWQYTNSWNKGRMSPMSIISYPVSCHGTISSLQFFLGSRKMPRVMLTASISPGLLWGSSILGSSSCLDADWSKLLLAIVLPVTLRGGPLLSVSLRNSASSSKNLISHSGRFCCNFYFLISGSWMQTEAGKTLKWREGRLKSIINIWVGILMFCVPGSLKCWEWDNIWSYP